MKSVFKLHITKLYSISFSPKGMVIWITVPLCKIVENMGKVMVGQSGASKLMVVCLAAGGHVLIEDVPGIGKNNNGLFACAINGRVI